MTMPDDFRLQAFAAAAAHCEVADNNDDAKEALKVYQEESDDQLKEDLKAGLGTWEKLKPAAQYQGFIDETLHEDNEMVLDPNYWDLRRKGYMPPLLSEELYKQREEAEAAYELAKQQAMMMGQPVPPSLEEQRTQAMEAYELAVQEAMMLGVEPPPPPVLPPEEVPGLWPLLLRCRSWVVEQVAAEYRRLDKQHRKREDISRSEESWLELPMDGGY